jgi:hypothetical protein
MNNITKFKPASEQPAVILAGTRLRDLLATFNAGAQTRDEISDDDRKQLALIESAVNKFHSSPIGIFTRDGWSDSVRSNGRDILDGVKRYMSTTVGSRHLDVDGKPIDIADIEEATVGTLDLVEIPNVADANTRLRLKRTGDQIIALIEKFIRVVSDGLRQENERLAALDDALDTAKRTPLLGQAIEILEQLLEGMDRFPDVPAWRHAANGVPPLVSELLQLRRAIADEPKLHNVAAQDLVEALRRRRERKSAA